MKNTMTATKTNAFINAVNFLTETTRSENGALKLASTGSALVDQFGKAGNYRHREIADVFEDQARIWDENSELALRFPFYLRMVTRKIKVNDELTTEKVQNGQGARDESFKRLLWVAKNHSTEFYNNLWVLAVVGSWKDMWTIMHYDIEYGVNTIDRTKVYDVIGQGLLCNAHVELVKKFMPRIKSMSKCNTEWTKNTNMFAKEFAKYMELSYQDYNKLKASGTAHTFQKLICSQKYDELKWNMIPGRALNLLVTSKFLTNHDLKENYTKWILEQPVAKFTGYAFELSKKLRQGNYIGWYNSNKEIPIEIKHTLDAQFNQLIETAKANGKITQNVWVGLDTSGSMNCSVAGLKDTSCSDIATSLALFFASMNTGAFHNKIIMFDDTSTPFDMKGESFCDRITTLPRVGCGGTNFQSIVDEIIKIRKENPNIPLEEYPTTILVVSDMQFNPTSYRWLYEHDSRADREELNYEYSKNALKTVFPSDFVDNMKFIWWDCASKHTDYEGKATDTNCMFVSGFDGSIMNMLLNEDSVIDESTKEIRKLTAEEMVEKALSQEILTYVNL